MNEGLKSPKVIYVIKMYIFKYENKFLTKTPLLKLDSIRHKSMCKQLILLEKSELMMYPTQKNIFNRF